MAKEEDSSECFPDIKIYDEDHLYVWSIFLVFSLIFAVSYADSWNYVAFGHIKKEIIDSRWLVRAVSVSKDDTSSAEPLTSMSVASGASTFEVWMTLPKWAAQAKMVCIPCEGQREGNYCVKTSEVKRIQGQWQCGVRQRWCRC